MSKVIGDKAVPLRPELEQVSVPPKPTSTAAPATPAAKSLKTAADATNKKQGTKAVTTTTGAGRAAAKAALAQNGENRSARAGVRLHKAPATARAPAPAIRNRGEEFKDCLHPALSPAAGDRAALHAKKNPNPRDLAMALVQDPAIAAELEAEAQRRAALAGADVLPDDEKRPLLAQLRDHTIGEVTVQVAARARLPSESTRFSIDKFDPHAVNASLSQFHKQEKPLSAGKACQSAVLVAHEIGQGWNGVRSGARQLLAQDRSAGPQARLTDDDRRLLESFANRSTGAVALGELHRYIDVKHRVLKPEVQGGRKLTDEEGFNLDRDVLARAGVKAAQVLYPTNAVALSSADGRAGFAMHHVNALAEGQTALIKLAVRGQEYGHAVKIERRGDRFLVYNPDFLPAQQEVSSAAAAVDLMSNVKRSDGQSEYTHVVETYRVTG